MAIFYINKNTGHVENVSHKNLMKNIDFSISNNPKSNFKKDNYKDIFEYDQFLLFKKLIGIDMKFKKQMKNPFSSKGSSSASCFMHNNILYLKCFASNENYNIITAVMKFYNESFVQAIKRIKNSINSNEFMVIEKRNQVYIPPTKESNLDFQVNIKPYTESEIAYWAKFSIKKSTLDYFNVESIYSFTPNNEENSSAIISKVLTFGYFIRYDEEANILKWKIYRPLNKTGEGKWFCNDKKYVFGLNKLKYKTDFLVITKSLKDVMVFYELGIEAIAVESESSVIPENVMFELHNKFKYIFINGDWDRAGIRLMIKMRKLYPYVIPYAIKNKEQYGKDISDSVEKIGFENVKTEVDRIKNSYSI